MQKKKIVYYDSLERPGMTNNKYLDALLRYIGDEAQTNGKPFLKEEWEVCAKQVPQQGNGNDCGVFTCMFADLVLNDIDVNELHQSMMEDFRRKICYAILRRQIPYPL